MEMELLQPYNVDHFQEILIKHMKVTKDAYKPNADNSQETFIKYMKVTKGTYKFWKHLL